MKPPTDEHWATPDLEDYPVLSAVGFKAPATSMPAEELSYTYRGPADAAPLEFSDIMAACKQLLKDTPTFLKETLPRQKTFTGRMGGKSKLNFQTLPARSGILKSMLAHKHRPSPPPEPEVESLGGWDDDPFALEAPEVEMSPGGG
jgi:hypothetical protein